MSKTKSRVFILIIILLVVLAGFFLLSQQDNVRIGFGSKDEQELQAGTYTAKDMNAEGTYAVIATTGEGTFQLKKPEGDITDQLELDDFLYKDARDRAPQVLDQVLFEEGDKLEIALEDEIIVEGDYEFNIKLIKR